MKLININVGIKIDNSQQIAEFLHKQNSDIITFQEIVRHLDNSVHKEYQSKSIIENAIGKDYPHKFFGPLWVSDAFRKNGEVYRDFGGLIEQGNEVLSKFPILNATNEHFYKTYNYAIDWTNWKSEDHGRALLISELNIDDKPLQIITLHGIWTEDKRGDQRTIDECNFVVKAALRKNIPTIIAGDFNLLPETESIGILNKHFRNLITEYKIKTTRPDFKDNLESGNNVVDYIFVNDLIAVKDFQVIHTDISDHLPLMLEFEI